MDSHERFNKRLRGEPVDRAPNFNIMMTFAAHAIGRPLSAYYQDYRVLVAANLAVLETYNLDIVQVISDPYREAADMGAEVQFPEDGLPICKKPPLHDSTHLDQLKMVEPAEGRRMSDRLEAVRLLREKMGGHVPVMGWVEGALAEAGDLRGVSLLMSDLYEQPEWLHELLERCTATAIAFARAQVSAGADIIGLGDAVASLVSPPMYREFALPYEQRIFAAVHEMGALARLHICGNTNRILADMVQSGADIIDLDWMVDFGRAAEIFGAGPAPCGNFDPVAVMLQGTPRQVKEAVWNCLRLGGPRSISAAGCEIPDGTPPENLHAHTAALLEFAAQPEAGP